MTTLHQIELKYPIHIAKAEDGFTATCRDIPSLMTQGETVEETLLMANEALDLILEVMVSNGEHIPLPSAPKAGEHLISAPLHLAIAVLSKKLRQEKGLTQSELARIAGISQSAACQLEMPIKSRRLDTIERTLLILGYRVTGLTIEVVK